jgi:hypothetical protein
MQSPGDNEDLSESSYGHESNRGEESPPIGLSPEEERALVQLQDALDCLVSNTQEDNRKNGSDDDCSAYMDACIKCPDILLNPSFRIAFLRKSDMDPWAAAKRIVSYWRERKFLFGEDAAFAPLTISVLPELFKEASVVLLPHRDAQGRTVIYLNRQELNAEQLCDHQGRAKCLFYMLDLAWQQNPNAASDGIVVLALVCKPTTQKNIPKSKDMSWWDSFFKTYSNLYEWKFPQHCVRMATEALPIKVSTIHLCTLPQSSGVGYLRTAAVNVCWNMLAAWFGSIIKVHHGGSNSPEADDEEEDGDETEAGTSEPDQSFRLHQASLLRQLRRHGLFKRQLPETVGGQFTMQSFLLWMQRQSNQELRAFASKEELLKRKRQVNLVHSREKRKRRRQEHDTLVSRAEILKAENEQAKAETLRLELLLQEAIEIVRTLDPKRPASPVYSPYTAPLTSPPSAGTNENITVPLPLHIMSSSAATESVSLERSPAFVLPPHMYSESCITEQTTQTNMLSSQGDDTPLLRLGEPLIDTLPLPVPDFSIFARETRGLDQSVFHQQKGSLTKSPNTLFTGDDNIPSAADLCEGFSDDDGEDYNLKPQSTGTQPVSIWSSMLGLFRAQNVHNDHSNSAKSNISRRPEGSTTAAAAISSNRQTSATDYFITRHSDEAVESAFAYAQPSPCLSSSWQSGVPAPVIPNAAYFQGYQTFPDMHMNVSPTMEPEGLDAQLMWSDTDYDIPTGSVLAHQQHSRSLQGDSAGTQNKTTTLTSQSAANDMHPEFTWL